MNVLPDVLRRGVARLAPETGMALREGGGSLAKYLAGAGAIGLGGAGLAALAGGDDEDDEEQEKHMLRKYLASRGER